MPLNTLPNFEIKKYCQNEPNFNGIYSRINSPKIKDAAYAINIHEYKSIETRWIALYGNDNNRRASIVLELNKFQKKLKYLQETI